MTYSDPNAEGSAQRLHALGRSHSLGISRRLGRAHRLLGGAGTQLSAAKQKYAQAADEYREAWDDALRLFSAEQLLAEGFRAPPPPPTNRRPRPAPER